MTWLILIGAVLILCFGFVLLFGAPYLPSLSQQMETGLDMLNLQPGQTMLELGCGDGKVVLAAAQRGWHCVGYELNPLLAALAWLRTRRYGRQVRIYWGNYWTKCWPLAEGIYGFVLPRFMAKLDTKIVQQQKIWSASETKLVSFAFTIPGRQPDNTEQGMYLYRYHLSD